MTRKNLEARRFEAAEDMIAGLSYSKIAKKYGVSLTTSWRWRRRLRAEGRDGLKRRKSLGRPARLTAAQRDELRAHYGDRPVYGREFRAWIKARYKVAYHPDYVYRLIHELGLRTEKKGRPRNRRQKGAGA
jgi:transposase